MSQDLGKDSGGEAEVAGVAKLKQMLSFGADGEPDEIHPDLAPWIVEDSLLGRILKHPLCYQVPYHEALAGLANRQYLEKRRRVAECRSDCDWGGLLGWYEKPYRLEALAGLVEGGELEPRDPEFWSLFFDNYIGVENWEESREHVEGWCEAAKMEGLELTRSAMAPDEAAAWAELCKLHGGMLPVSRGWSRQDGQRGYSWTVSQVTAEWFASRLVQPGETPAVAVGRVPALKVFAYFTRRGESEVFVPWDSVEVSHVQRPGVSFGESRPWVSFDFDGVLHTDCRGFHPVSFSRWNLEPHPDMLDAVRAAAAENNVAIVTARFRGRRLRKRGNRPGLAVL